MAEQADQLIDLPTIAEGETDSAATEVYNNVKVSLADLCAKATSNYARKNYNAAVDYYARASELQAELNGEMDPDNAEILFLYGRSLFKVGQSKSDVLGGRAGGEKKKPSGAAKSKSAKKEEPSTDADKVAEEGVALIAESNETEKKEEEDADAKKPLFQFTGDENFEDSDDEDAEGGEEEDEDEDEDDLAAAFEVLDLARVLFVRKLDQPGDGAEKGKEVGDSPITTHMKERLAETHDILAEISLENERFPSAVSDFRQSLEYKQRLYPFESEVIAEAHYKLSLALEFASITTTAEDDAEADDEANAEAKKDTKGDSKDTQIDEAMREEAAKELEQAIASTKLKLQSKEVDLASTLSVDDNDITIAQIALVKEVIAEMEQRLLDLRADPVDVNAALNGASGLLGNVNPMGGILGNTLGESSAETQARIDEAKKTATDLSGLVRRKKEKASNGDSNGTDAAKAPVSNGKRKAEDIEEEEATDSSAKKAKVEDVADAKA